MSRAQTYLVTGFPSSYLAVRVVRRLLQDPLDHEVWVVCQAAHLAEAETFLGPLSPHDRARVRLLEGDCSSMDLGLSGREFREVAGQVNVIHHCAAVTFLGAERQAAERCNVDGAREVLELAESTQSLERIVHWSTAFVSGARHGFILEDELSELAGFRNPIEQSRFRAERLMQRARERFPVTILRPSNIVGDSQNGEIDRFDGPYLLILLMLSTPPDLRLPIPGRGELPLNLVPIDFVVEAGLAIAGDPRSVGSTYHIVDPDPLTARKVFDLIAGATGRPLPRSFVPANLASTILRTPGLERWSHVPRGFVEQLTTEVVYDDRNARPLLAAHGVQCPPFESYVETLVRFVRTREPELHGRAPPSTLEDVDPLA